MADILSQDEVDLLLGAVAQGEAAEHAEAAEPTVEGLHLASYDFRRPERVSKEQLKGLQSLFESFAREVSIVFPPFLRTVVRIDLISIDQLTYDEFILSVARPTALAIINMAPLEGSGVIELSPAMIFPMVDRVLGGKGEGLADSRELTEIENRIITRIVMMILDSWRRSWAQVIEFDFNMLALESDPLIVQVVVGSEMVVLVGYEVHVGEVIGMMNMCVPLLVLNPVLDQISRQAHFMRRMTPEMAQKTRQALGHTVGKTRVALDAALGHTVLSLHEVARLQVGDVIQLDTSPEEAITVEVGGIPRFLAQPGRRGEQSSVQLTGLTRD